MDHAEEARRLLGLVDEAVAREGGGVPAGVGVQFAIGHALLAINDTIRQQGITNRLASGPGGPRGASFSNSGNPDVMWMWRQLPRPLATRFGLAVGDRVE